MCTMQTRYMTSLASSSAALSLSRLPVYPDMKGIPVTKVESKRSVLSLQDLLGSCVLLLGESTNARVPKHRGQSKNLLSAVQDLPIRRRKPQTETNQRVLPSNGWMARLT